MSPPCQNVSRAGRRLVAGTNDGTNQGDDMGTICGMCDGFTFTGPDGRCEECGSVK
jgi:hypothetical protein